MPEKSPAPLLLTTACLVLAMLFAFLAFDSPKYSPDAATRAATTVTDPAPARAMPDAIDINTADAETLMQIKGIGEKRAAAIIAYREAHGRFLSVEELAEVDGISAVFLEEHAELLTVS